MSAKKKSVRFVARANIGLGGSKSNDHKRKKEGWEIAPPYYEEGQFAPIPTDIAERASVNCLDAAFSAVASSAKAQSPVEEPPTAKPSFQAMLNAKRAQQDMAANSGDSAQQQNTNNNNNAAPASLFGSSTTNNANTQQTQPATGTGLFGNNTNSTFGNPNASSSIFGASSNTASTNNIFVKPAATQAQPASSSLFGTQNSSNNTSSLFGAQPATNNNSSLFGNTARPAQQQAPSLLGATQTASLNQSTPFGRLSMGQNTTAPAAQAASQVTIDNLKGTTRFEDCADSVRQELEALDKMIQLQEQFAKRIEAFLPKHEENLNSLTPDINFVKDKADDVEQSLAADAHGVDAQRKNAEKDLNDGQRLQRIVTNLALPQPYQYPNLSTNGISSMYSAQQRSQQQQSTAEGDENYDTDLIGNYFLPMAAELQRTMDSYASNLIEIEQHMRVIESSTVQQAQQLAQRRSGIGAAQPSGDDTVRELATTLRGFEESILGVAGIVGECREGVTQLALGRLGSHLGSSVR